MGFPTFRLWNCCRICRGSVEISEYDIIWIWGGLTQFPTKTRGRARLKLRDDERTNCVLAVAHISCLGGSRAISRFPFAYIVYIYMSYIYIYCIYCIYIYIVYIYHIYIYNMTNKYYALLLLHWVVLFKKGNAPGLVHIPCLAQTSGRPTGNGLPHRSHEFIPLFEARSPSGVFQTRYIAHMVIRGLGWFEV